MDFSDELRRLLAQIPEGRVSTYGDVAKALGEVRAARAVSDSLANNRMRFHRIVTADGKAKAWQIAPLRRDGILVSKGRIVDLPAHRFSDFASEYPLRTLQEEQERIAKRVVLQDGFETVQKVCGFDLAYADDSAIGAFAVVDFKSREVVEKGHVLERVDFPYVPGLLAYRELPVIRAAYQKMESDPSVLLVDGHGYAHPRRAGIACHVGVETNKPTIGVGKSVLVGEPEIPPKSGSFRLMQDGEIVGYGLRSAASAKPIYVSPGHLVSLDSSVRIVGSLCRTRIPEPLRQAHSLAASIRLG